KTENILKEERELLRTLIDNIPASIFIKDLELRKTLVNRAECELMGVKDASEILGKNNYELFPKEFARVTTAEDMAVLSTGIATIDEEKDVIWLDGSLKRLLTSKIPLYDKGKISGLLGITHDISKITEAESALSESENKFRKIFENIQDVFYQTDQAGLITEISPSIEKHSGYTREEVIGNPVTSFYYNMEDRQALMQEIMANGMVSDFEVRLKTKAGEKRYSSVNAQLIKRNEGIVGTEGSMRDVTERKIQEDSLRSLNNDLKLLNDQKNKLLSVIAHDLRNPISGSVALLEVIFTDLDSTSRDELIEYLGIIQKGVLSAHELLEDLLEWARIQFHSVDFIPVLIPDIAANIRHTLKKLKPLAETKQIRLLQDIEDNLPIMADKHMFASIIRTLVTNAIKFTNKDGQVSISAKRQKNGCLFSITDNGVGVPEENIDKLFSDDTGFTSYGTQGEKGTGLGLGLCRNFVEKHGGTIWAESVKGSGSTFFFTILDQEVNE
ncbi:MAG: PAS domain S-box protein, partial [Daejeonella sp.]